LHAVESRQAEIEDHEVGREGAPVLERRRTVGRGAYLIALHAQRALERLGDVLVILDDQDAWCSGEIVHRLYVAVGTKAMVRLPGRFRRLGVEVARDGCHPQTRPCAPASGEAKRACATPSSPPEKGARAHRHALLAAAW